MAWGKKSSTLGLCGWVLKAGTAVTTMTAHRRTTRTQYQRGLAYALGTTRGVTVSSVTVCMDRTSS